jgi:aromatic ring-opening dioxygenase catalytic subunit (LigB family)
MDLLNTARTLPTYYLSHGGGPWPWMKNEMPGVWDNLEYALKQIPGTLGKPPAAILIISAHWERREFTVMTNEFPPMLYDYSGFPEETYRVRYPAPGNPALATEVQALLQAAGLPVASDAERGFDHGTFVPLSVMYPEANVPVVQLSLAAGLDPQTHVAAGRALSPLREKNVLIIGSGLSYHNLRAFGAVGTAASREFDAWLCRILELPPTERAAELIAWERAPAARTAHPREEHLAPLFVAQGAAFEETSTRVYHETQLMGGITASSFRFG